MATQKGGFPGTEESKLFLGGLPQCSTNESLRNYFIQFGMIDEVKIMMDPVTDKSRGFGFVKFVKPEDAKTLLVNTRDHIVDGKKIELKVAYKKGEEPVVQEMCQSQKIFVGGLTKELTEDKLREYFSPYGQIKEIQIKKQLGTDKIRGFGFVEFFSREPVDVLLLQPMHTICGRQVEVKKVEPKEKTRPFHKIKTAIGFINAMRGENEDGGGRMMGVRDRSNRHQPYGGNFTTFNDRNPNYMEQGGTHVDMGYPPPMPHATGYGNEQPHPGGYIMVPPQPPPGPPPTHFVQPQQQIHQPPPTVGNYGSAVASYAPQPNVGYHPPQPTQPAQPGTNVNMVSYPNVGYDQSGYAQHQAPPVPPSQPPLLQPPAQQQSPYVQSQYGPTTQAPNATTYPVGVASTVGVAAQPAANYVGQWKN